VTLDERARAEILATFRAELGEHCQTLTAIFLALEKEPETDERGRLLDEAFRSAHSLKGAARAVAFGAVEALGHELEAVLEAARDADLELSPALFDALYAVVDSLAGAFGDNGAPALSDAESQDLVRQLGAAHAGPATLPGARRAPAAPAAQHAAPQTASIAVAGHRAGSAAPAHRDGRVFPPSAAGETIRLPAALLQERGCDLLVSDVEMPEIDGVELTAHLRLDPKLRDLPVILVTTRDSAADRQRGLEAGADAYIVKSSFDQDHLLRTIAELI